MVKGVERGGPLGLYVQLRDSMIEIHIGRSQTVLSEWI